MTKNKYFKPKSNILHIIQQKHKNVLNVWKTSDDLKKSRVKGVKHLPLSGMGVEYRLAVCSTKLV